MIQVSITQLADALQKAPPFVLPQMDKGASYLYDKVYKHLVSGGAVRLSDLDFSAFDEDDIHSLAGIYGDVFERNSYQADSIADTLRKAAPTCKAVVYI